MYTFIRILILTTFAVALSACANAINTYQEEKELVGPEWIVESFLDTNGTRTDPGTVTLTVRFFVPDSFAAKADNDIWGRYIAHNSTLSINIKFYTKRGLSPGSRENEFMEALDNASAWTINGNKLRVYYFGRTKMLNLVAKQ